jgi:hypothetical protein
MGHTYSIHQTARPGGLHLAGYTVECSCGHSELVPWLGKIVKGKPVGETERECREHAAQVALQHAGSSMTLTTRAEYRTRRFVRSTEGMEEMFPGAR